MSATITFKKVDKEGWLEKQSRLIKRWRRRWFVLDGNLLYTFKGERTYTDPTEVIDLRIYTSVRSTDAAAANNSFEIYSDSHTFSLIAPNREEKEDWIRALGRAIVVASHALQEEDEDYDEDEEYTY